MNHYCTYFNIHYIHRGLALYRSLERHDRNFTLWILCFDDRTFEILTRSRLPHARLIRRQDFEAGDEALLRAQKNRSEVEYFWTCTPSLPLFIFRQDPSIAELCYVDADIFFFSDPNSIFRSLGDGSIFILPHDYDEKIYQNPLPTGRFNVGVMVFKSDLRAMNCLRWWRERCLEWCYRKFEDGKFGDQGYLEDWPDRFPGVVISCQPAIHAGPWNIGKYPLRITENKALCVADQPLVCFHFHALELISRKIALIGEGEKFLNHFSREYVYRPYIRALAEAIGELNQGGHKIHYQRGKEQILFFIARSLRGSLRWNFIIG